MESGLIEKTYNKYINIPQSVEISTLITNLTGVTRELCDDGISIIDALIDFHDAYICCDEIVAHNLEFDKEMIRIEIGRNRNAIRLQFPEFIEPFNINTDSSMGITTFCTMKSSVDLCNIVVNVPPKIPQYLTTGCRSYKKFPKLSELYQKLFDIIPENLHDAEVDTTICLQCYLKLREVFDNMRPIV